jgi:photosystem II stability/assembly factor-like uncharacterized protein
MIKSSYIKLIFVSVLFLITFNALYSQKPELNLNQKDDMNFFEIQKKVYDEWGDKSEKDIRGYKQFKRWEYFWLQRTYPTGNFPDGLNILDEYQKFNSSKIDNPNLLSTKWKSLGPYSEPTDAGGSQGIGRVNSICINPVNSNEIWVGAASGGLWKSADGGSTFTDIPFTQFLSLGISDIAISNSNPKIIYVSTGDIYGSASSKSFYTIGLIKSTDGGITWKVTSLNNKLEDKILMGRVIIHPSNSNIVYVATSKGIHKTSDGGASWKQSEKSSHFIDLEFKPNDANVIYGSTFSFNGGCGVFVSKDAGETWTKTLSNASAVRIAIATTEANPEKVYALAATVSTYAYNSMNVSMNSGETWEKVSDILSASNILGWYMGSLQSDTKGQGWYDLCLVASPTDENLIYTGGVNLWKSVNGGISFTKVSHWVPTKNGYPYIHADQHSLTYGPDKNTLFVTNDGGIDKTTNGGTTWTALDKGLNITQYYRIGTSQVVEGVVVAGAQDNGTAMITGNTWKRINGSDGMECLIDYTNPQRVYSSYYNGSLQRSVDGGANFSSMLSNNTTKESGAWVTPFVINPVNPRTLYAGYTNVWKTDNYGASGSWKKISQLSPNSSLQSLAVAPSDTNVIYAASLNQVFATYDGGTKWDMIHTDYSYVTYIAVDPANPRRIWVTKSGFEADNKVLEIIDSTIVRNLTGNLPNIPVNTIVYQENSPDRLYIGTDLGVYVSDYNSGYWQKFGEDMPNVMVNELEIQKSSNTLYAATYGRGLWSAPLINCNAVQPQIEVVGSIKFCAGDSLILRAKNNYSNYLWSTGETTKEIKITKSGSYSLFVNDGSGCYGRSEQFYIPKSLYETISVEASEGEYLCPDGTLNIIASPVGFSEYKWSNGEKSRQIVINEPGYYSCIGISPDGCVVESEPVYFEMKPAPEKPLIIQEGRTLKAPYANKYQWYLDGKRLFNQTSREYFIPDGKIGNYTVLVTNEFGCTTLSDPLNIETSVENNILSDFEINVSSNPGNGNYVLEFSNQIYGKLNIQITDVNGKEVLIITKDIDGLRSQQIDLSNFANGIYFANISANNFTKFLKLIKI